MPRRKAHNWRRARGWRSHSVACWDAEWAEWCRAAQSAGKSTNGWVREWLNEAVKYERLADRGDQGGEV